MAVAVINTSSASGTGASLTFSHLTAASGVTMMLVGIETPENINITSVTYNGVAMTQVYASTASVGTRPRCHIWGLLNPATGTNNVVITPSASTTMYAGATTFSGTAQYLPLFFNQCRTNSNTCSPLGLNSIAGDLVFKVTGSSTAITPHASQTNLWNIGGTLTHVGSVIPGGTADVSDANRDSIYSVAIATVTALESDYRRPVTGGEFTGTINNGTTNFTVDIGTQQTNGCLLFMFWAPYDLRPYTITATYGGVSMTLSTSNQQTFLAYEAIKSFYLAGAAGGSNTLQLTSNSSFTGCKFQWAYFKNIDQVAPLARGVSGAAPNSLASPNDNVNTAIGGGTAVAGDAIWLAGVQSQAGAPSPTESVIFRTASGIGNAYRFNGWDGIDTSELMYFAATRGSYLFYVMNALKYNAGASTASQSSFFLIMMPA